MQWQLFQNINDEIEVLRTAGLRNDPAQSQRPAPDDPDGIMGWLDGRGIVQQVCVLSPSVGFADVVVRSGSD